MMLTDITTIIWKEAREFLTTRPGLRGGWTGLLIILAVFGILIPLQSGIDWLRAPTTILMWAWLPFILVNSVVADSFAGERERHTLETLLASRLSDKAILIGKICSAIVYGWGITLAGIIVALATVNIANWNGEFLFFPTTIGIAILGLSFLVAWLAAGLGVMVSLRAGSVRQAQQTLSVAFLVLFIPLLILPLLPSELQVTAQNALRDVDLQQVLIIISITMTIIDLVLLGVAFRQFKRSQLILAGD
jgi:ABC-2 type transport system permease protein